MASDILPFRIFGNLYFVGNYKASSHMIDTGDGLILIDTGYKNDAETLIDSLSLLGYDIRDVKIILHSHGHYDHTDATAELLTHCNAKTYLAEADLRYIKGFTPDVYFTDGMTVSLGNTEILCRATPGHTLGTFSFFWTVTENGRSLRAGMFGGAGVKQVTKDYLDKHGLYYHQRGDFFDSLQAMQSEEVDLFIGNHSWQNHTRENAEILRAGGENRFIDSTAWGRFLTETEDSLRAMIKKESVTHFVNYAHRGAPAYCPENTMLSFYTGLYMGANGMETDVRRTKDGALVLFHDKTLERTTGESGAVSDYTLDDLRAFSVKKNGLHDRIPTLEEFLYSFAFRDLTLAVELKDDGIEEDVLALLRKYNAQKKTVITAFRLDRLKAMHALDPLQKLGYLAKGEITDDLLAELRSCGIDELCPSADQITGERVAHWHERGFRVRAWGVSDEEKMKNVYMAGADGMTVNFPDKLTAERAKAE